jgi:hypothetical protein
MTWIGLLLLGIGASDLVFSIRPMRHVPELSGAALVVGVGLLVSLTSGRDLAALAVLAGAVVAWGQVVTRGFATGRAWPPLGVLSTALALAIALSPYAGHADGPLADWLHASPFPLLERLDPDRAVLLIGVMLAQLSTGNVVVRLVLTATGTVNPARLHGREVPTYQLKGGRLLGPMERVFIVGFGLAGELTAASIVVAAKGLLRWPELQDARRRGSRRGGPGIHALTEYFLVGSFVSWLFALAGLLLVRA